MRNKKNKGDGGAAAAAAAATTASPSGASNTSCYLQVRERADRKKGAGREKNGFSVLERRRGHRKPSRRGPRFALDSVARPPLIALISLA